jgi:hypothetical protein
MALGGEDAQYAPKRLPVRPVPRNLSGNQQDTTAARPVNPNEPSWGGQLLGYPGTGPGANNPAQYQSWWNANKTELSLYFQVNPGREREILSLLWQYENTAQDEAATDTLVKQWAMRGLVSPAAGATTSGGRSYGGGGGMSAADKAKAYESAFAAVRNEAAKLGVALDDGGLNALAKTVVDNNWSNDQLMDYLVPAALAGFESGTDTSRISTIALTTDQIKKFGQQQLLTVSDATAREWAGKVASGEMDPQAIQSVLAQQARTRYAWAASAIDSGMAVRDMLLPSRDRIANELEMDASQIDLMDPKWLGMLQTTDEKTGGTRLATDGEVVMRVRKDPQWAQTRNASRVASDMAMMVRGIFEGGG